MAVHHGLSPRLSAVPGQRNQLVNLAAIATAALSALLYLLSGTVGSIRLVFSVGMTVAFAVVAVALYLVAERRVWELVAVADLVALIGYFAVAPSRDPHFEAWGIAIKVVQVALLAAVGYLIVRARRVTAPPPRQ